MNEQYPYLTDDNEDPMRIVIVAAYPTVQYGLRAAVEDDGQFVVEELLSDLAGIPGSADDLEPDGFVADIAWTAEDLAAVGDLADLPPILLLSETAEDALTALTAGFRGVLLRDATTDEIQSAIVSLAAGLSVLDSRVLPLLGGTDRPAAASSQLASIEPLTNRETEVLELIAAGLTNKGIAIDLGISEHTVKFHVGSILSKLNAASRSEAIARAMQAGLLHV